jgi:hypothetical protein
MIGLPHLVVFFSDKVGLSYFARGISILEGTFTP